MNNKSCPEEMGNWTEKTFYNGVGIIYSLVRRPIKLMRYGTQGPQSHTPLEPPCLPEHPAFG